MAQTITLLEHEAAPFPWTDRDLAVLDRLRHTLGYEVLRPTVVAGQRLLRAGHHIGVVRLGARTVQVLPKLHRSGITSEQERTRDATANLLQLLAYAGQLPVRDHEVMPLLQRGADWFEILTRLFVNHLRDEWRRGAHHTYQIVEEELPILKGRWRIVEQLRRPEQRHIFAVAHDEFTADNPLNRVLRYVVERLWRLTRDAANRAGLAELRNWMVDVTLLPCATVADADAALLTRLNRQYAPLLTLARLFLGEAAPDLAAGSVATFAFLLDMNRLFESFVVGFIMHHRDKILPPELVGCELIPQARGVAPYLARRDGQGAFRLQPDLALRAGRVFPLLLDAKYKVLDSSATHAGIGRDDFYQAHAYARRFGSPRVILLYPQTAALAAPFRARFVLEGSTHEIVAASVDLQVRLDTPAGRQHIVEELQGILGMEAEDERSGFDVAG